MQSKLIPKQFKVTNYRNIDDSGWIPLDRVTALVGRNESGKTTLLKALHKFNPATPEPYNAQREFPRDRFTRDYKNGGDWPVCAVQFSLSDDFIETLRSSINTNIPNTVTIERFYDGSLIYEYDIQIIDDVITSNELSEVIRSFCSDIRRVIFDKDMAEEEVQALRSGILEWATAYIDRLVDYSDLNTEKGLGIIKEFQAQANKHSRPETADAVEKVLREVHEIQKRAESEPISTLLWNAIEEEIPVFIYFENYGILDSSVYLPNFLSDSARTPDSPRVRTINAMFSHVQLDAQELADLGRETTESAKNQSKPVTDAMIKQDQESKELRAVKLNSASLDITKRFSSWYKQRRHTIRYDADGNYFRIWVADDRRPGVDIELESRSRGFQWFFSFYLVFLVESNEGHRDAVLLLDEPGLNLHPTAQQELIEFFEELSHSNMILYSTHSPFLIDGNHIQRVRPVTEDESGHSHISIDGWPRDRETIFPLQAAAGYAMVRGLFQHKKNVLVEGMADYLFLHTFNLLCRATGRIALPDDIYITPCGGTKFVGHIASLFLGQEVRPLVLLDSDDAGRARRDALLKELYSNQEQAILMLSEVLGSDECEVEDILGEEVFVHYVSDLLGKKISLTKSDRASGGLVDQIQSACERLERQLPEGWKAEIARRLSINWSHANLDDLPIEVLDRASSLFRAICDRFDGGVNL
ncbi:AAA family ATPase [bacterium]|nr:AAA family ATPase [bacterium]